MHAILSPVTTLLGSLMVAVLSQGTAQKREHLELHENGMLQGHGRLRQGGMLSVVGRDLGVKVGQQCVLLVLCLLQLLQFQLCYLLPAGSSPCTTSHSNLDSLEHATPQQTSSHRRMTKAVQAHRMAAGGVPD